MKYLFLLLLVSQTLAGPIGPFPREDRKVLIVKAGNSHCSYSIKELDILPEHKVLTKNTWRAKQTLFTGPDLGLLVRACNNNLGRVSTLYVKAINEYQVEIPFSDLDKYHPVLAVRENGKLMPVNQKGPLWVIYPVDSFSDLKNLETDGKMIWQVKSIEVR